MKNIFVTLIIMILMGTGCSISPNREHSDINTYKNIDNKNDYFNSDINSEAFNIQNLLTDSGKFIRTNTQLCTIKYHKLHSIYRNIVIEGNIGINEDKHPIILDTGASQPVILNSAIVKKNNLPVYNLKNINTNLNGHEFGICQLSKLEFGEVTCEGWPCIYFESHNKLNLFEIPIASSIYDSDNIILGLPLLREFKYIRFDNINKEAQLSYYQPFSPQYPEEWNKYPIYIEEDFHGNAFLFVRINIAGYETELQLDTGSGKGIAISESLWQKINDNLKETKLKKGKDFYPYIGNLPCKKGEISEFEFGNRTINNAKISIFNDDCPLLDGCEGLVGMQFFSNTEFVLDFEYDLMWIKK